MKKEILKRTVNFLFEVSVLKRTHRTGWRNIDVIHSETVAEHVFLASQIAFLLGEMEKANSEKSALIALFHDNGEAKVGDIDLMGQTYLRSKEGEIKAFFDQIKGLICEKKLKKLYQEWKEQTTKEAIIAKDADLIELIIQAKHHLDKGNQLAKVWIKNAKRKLKTKSAKEIVKVIEKTKIDDWWKKIIKEN